MAAAVSGDIGYQFYIKAKVRIFSISCKAAFFVSLCINCILYDGYLYQRPPRRGGIAIAGEHDKYQQLGIDASLKRPYLCIRKQA
jgi:hypothetical protein